MAHVSTQLLEERISKFGKLWMFDDLIRLRGRDEEQVPILGYPKHDHDATEYEYFTGRDLDRMVDEACRALIRAGLQVNSDKTVALLAASDLSFVITFFALFRLGCKVLTMSIRLTQQACLHLLERVDCNAILHGTTTRISSTTAEIKQARPDVMFIRMLAREDFDRPQGSAKPFQRPIPDKEAEHAKMVLMVHSSGSAGLPKPLLLSHRSLFASIVSGTGLKAFNALPWYHVHGLVTSVQAMWMRRPAHLFNANLPLTADNLILALKSIQPEICHTVPYMLQLIAERPDGVELLKRCKFVTAGGARTPDELGNRVVKAGVKLGLIYGLSEVGHVGDSIFREPGDDSWDYIRPYAHVQPHAMFKKVGGDIYEAVYLKSHPALLTTNSNDPPGSYHSGDLFTPHPTIEQAWKYVARADDRVTLLSGEKILPLGMEGTIRQNVLVRESVMVGNDRLVPGLLVFRSAAAAGLSDDEFLAAIQPSVDEANSMADEFARITPDMIAPLAADIEYSVTDKNNIIIATAYARFEDIINNLYDKDQDTARSDGSEKLKLDIEQLEQFISRLLHQQAGIDVPDTDTDLFAAGIDSLRAAQVRRLLQRDLDLGEHSLPTNIVYDAGSIAKLARVLFAMRTGEKIGDVIEEDAIAQMEKIIRDNSEFRPWTPGELPTPDKDVVILTGATGALGAHILDQLLDDPKVERVFCLVRGEGGLARIDESMKVRKLGTVGNDKERARKVEVLVTNNLGAPNLGLSPGDFMILQESTTLIIHAAWPVNFNISLASLVPHIRGLYNLLELSLRVPFKVPARLIYASSISAAFRLPAPARVPEGPLQSLSYSAPTGYARSKLVSEHICPHAAASGAVVGVLRIGQISADTIEGIWNDKEAIPSLVRSAVEVRALPRLAGNEDKCGWMPVDTVARTCLQLIRKLPTESREASFYNLKPPHSFSWTEQFLPALRKAGLEFEDVSPEEWLTRLCARAEELGPAAETVLPAAKLVDYYKDAFVGSSVGLGGDMNFDIEKACRDSSAIRQCPQILEAGLVPKMLKHWLGSSAANPHH